MPISFKYDTRPSLSIVYPNLTMLTFGNLTMWYSYETLVAFNHTRTGLVVHENIWSQTTGKHLKLIDFASTTLERSLRVDSETFDFQLREALR